MRRRVRQVAAWQRPRLVAKGGPDRDQVLAGLRQTIAELPDGAVVLAEDETHINLLPWVRATWIPTGQRQQVMTPGTNRRRTIFGAVDLQTGRFLYQLTRKAISASFTAFCEQLLAAYPAAPVVAVVCDNVIIHHSKLVQSWLAAHPRMRVLHGARYSPHDNPTERIWGALKAWLANSPTLTIQGRVRQVHTFFRQRAPAQMLATAAPHSSPWLPEGYMQNFRQAALGRSQPLRHSPPRGIAVQSFHQPVPASGCVGWNPLFGRSPGRIASATSASSVLYTARPCTAGSSSRRARRRSGPSLVTNTLIHGVSAARARCSMSASCRSSRSSCRW